MRRLRYHPDARAELREILKFLCERNIDAARAWYQEVQRVGRLAEHTPAMGHRRPDLTDRPLRFLVVEHVLLVYLEASDGLVVLALLDGRRDPSVIADIIAGR